MKLTQREIAAKVGKSEAAVSKIVKKKGIPKEDGKIDFDKYGGEFSAPVRQYSYGRQYSHGLGHLERERLELGNELLRSQIVSKKLDNSKKELEMGKLRKTLVEREEVMRLLHKIILLNNSNRKEVMSKALEAGSLPEVRKRHFEMEDAFRSGNEEFLRGMKELMKEMGLQLDLGAFLVGEPTEWIEDNVVLVNSQKHGKYSFTDVPYFREVVRDFFRPEVRELHIKSSAQVGKTQLIVSLMAYLIYHDPSPILFITANDDLVEDFSKIKFAKTMKASNLTKVLFTKSNTINLKSFPGGSVFFTNSLNERNLISRSLKYIFCDEVSRWENHNAISLLRSRMKAFALAKLITFGSPMVKGSCLTSELYESGDRGRYHVPCPGCGEYIHLEFKHLKYKEGVHYECQKCKHKILEGERREVLQKGKFIAEGESENGIKSYHLSEMVSLLSSWQNIVAEWKRSKGDVARLRTFMNMTLGEAWDDRREDREWSAAKSIKAFLEGRIKYPSEVPRDVVVLTMGVDVQVNRLEGEVVGWGVGKVYGIEKFVIHGEVDNPSTWEALKVITQKTYEHESGKHLKVGAGFIDSGYQAQMVYDFVEANRGANLYAIKGHNKVDYPIVDLEKAKRQKPILIGVHQAKEALYQELADSLKGEGRRYFFPMVKEYGKEYFAGLFSERKTRVVSKSNKASYAYVQVGSRYNEALGCRVYALAGYFFLGVDLAAYAKQEKLYHEVQEEVPEVRVTRHYHGDLEV